MGRTAIGWGLALLVSTSNVAMAATASSDLPDDFGARLERLRAAQPDDRRAPAAYADWKAQLVAAMAHRELSDGRARPESPDAAAVMCGCTRYLACHVDGLGNRTIGANAAGVGACPCSIGGPGGQCTITYAYPSIPATSWWLIRVDSVDYKSNGAIPPPDSVIQRPNTGLGTDTMIFIWNEFAPAGVALGLHCLRAWRLRRQVRLRHLPPVREGGRDPAFQRRPGGSARPCARRDRA